MNKRKKHLESPELAKIRERSGNISRYNGTSCGFLYKTVGKTEKIIIKTSITSSRYCCYDYKGEIIPIFG